MIWCDTELMTNDEIQKNPTARDGFEALTYSKILYVFEVEWLKDCLDMQFLLILPAFFTVDDWNYSCWSCSTLGNTFHYYYWYEKETKEIADAFYPRKINGKDALLPPFVRHLQDIRNLI